MSRELSHEIDLAHYLFGRLSLLHAYVNETGSLQCDVEDCVVIIAETNDRACVTIRSNFCTTPKRRRLTIRGNQGEIMHDFVENV